MTTIYEAILFDLDGVLIDSLAVVERHWRQWAADYGLDFDCIKTAAFGRPSVEIVAEFAPHLDAETIGRQMEAAEAADTDGLIVFPAAGPLLRSLPSGRWAVATSGDRATATTRLRFGELPIPDVFITANDVRRGKPHPEPYLRAAAGLGVDPAACLVIEDTPAGIAAGKAAGAQVIGVASTHSRDQLAAANAIVDDLSQITVSPETDGRLRVQIS